MPATPRDPATSGAARDRSTGTPSSPGTNGPFIDRAKELLATGTYQIPIFNTLLDGRDCDSRWTWHPDPFNVQWADAAIEVCDGIPSDVEADKPYWFSIGFCPWSAVLTEVDDRR